MNCLNCTTETNNPKFCSRSCSAAFNNKIPKRKRKIILCECGNECLPQRTKCPECNENKRIELKTKEKLVKGNANSFGYPMIRDNARRVYFKSHSNPKCEVCGYGIHIEVHHKLSIQSFPASSLVSEINSPSNLIGLCPNHHWEADHKIINFR